MSALQPAPDRCPSETSAASVQEWQDAFSDWLLVLSADRKPKTVQFNQRQLSLIITWALSQNVALADFRGRHLTRYLAGRATGALSHDSRPISPTTRHHDATVARAFFRWANREGYIPANPLADYEIRKPPRPCVRVPSEADVRQLLRAVKERWQPAKNQSVRFLSDAARDFHRTRAYAIILGLVKTGARPCELLSLRLEDYDPQRRQIVFPDTKGNEPRVLPISAEWAAAVADYLRVRRRYHVNATGPLLFVSNTGDPLTVDAFRLQFREYVAFAKIPPITLYGLRHFAINDMAKSNLLLASQIAGHKDLKTTRNYLHMDADWMRAEYDRIEPLTGAAKGNETIRSKSTERARKRRLV